MNKSCHAKATNLKAKTQNMSLCICFFQTDSWPLSSLKPNLINASVSESSHVSWASVIAINQFFLLPAFLTAREAGWHLLLPAIRSHRRQADRGRSWGQKPEENGRGRPVRWGAGTMLMPTCRLSLWQGFLCVIIPVQQHSLLRRHLLFFLFQPQLSKHTQLL